MKTTDAAKLVSMPVIAFDRGRVLGRVRDVMLDIVAHELAGLVVATHGRGDAYLPLALIRAFGTDAVTVGDAAAMAPTAGRMAVGAASVKRLRGVRIVTEGGDAVGKLGSTLIQADGHVAQYEAVSGLYGQGAGLRSIRPA